MERKKGELDQIDQVVTVLPGMLLAETLHAIYLPSSIGAPCPVRPALLYPSTISSTAVTPPGVELLSDIVSSLLLFNSHSPIFIGIVILVASRLVICSAL